MNSPKGFRFAAVAAGFKPWDRNDLGVVLSDFPCCVAGVFTTNLFKAAPVLHCMEALERGDEIRGVVVNAGQANACTGAIGRDNCTKALSLVAQAAGCKASELLPASTGVIGMHMKMDKWDEAAPKVGEALGKCEPVAFAKAIMTTDAFPKSASAEVRCSGGTVRLFGTCKGAGMIAPNMATMLGFVFCDAKVDPLWWQMTLSDAAISTFNNVTVDGDTSTNDCVIGLANGASGVTVTEQDKDVLADAVKDICSRLAYMLVQDAEGGTRVARIHVRGAEDNAQAEQIARTIGHSQLVKTAVYGKDANWGRIMAAAGRSGVVFDPDAAVLCIGGVKVFEDGVPVEGDLDALLAAHMRRDEISIELSIGAGSGEHELLAADLTHEYVSINADYRT